LPQQVCLGVPQDVDGETALHCAARGGHLRMVQLLLQNGADPSVRNKDGRTAAAESEDPTVVAALVQAVQQQQAAGAAAATPAAATGGEAEEGQQPWGTS
jgi:ankyrin repeat protein